MLVLAESHASTRHDATLAIARIAARLVHRGDTEEHRALNPACPPYFKPSLEP